MLIRYIHLNPVGAGLVKTIEELSAYPYSGHSALIGRKKLYWYGADETLALFGKSKAKARRAYLDFVEDGCPWARIQSMPPLPRPPAT